jgi:hypothetical protein
MGIIIIIIILDSYIAHVSTLQGPQGAPTLPGYARLPIRTLTAFQGIPIEGSWFMCHWALGPLGVKSMFH